MPPDAEMATVDSLLKEGDMAQVRRMIDRSFDNARDSDAYYHSVILLSKYYFATMQADSFLLCNGRLAHYLARREGQSSALHQRMLVECALQRGVYESRMTGNMPKAISHYHQVLALIGGSQDPDLVNKRIVTLLNLADTHKQEGTFDQAVDYYRRAMELADRADMGADFEIILDMGIASAYASMHSFDQSEHWWRKAEALYDAMSPADKFFYLNNRGNDLYLQGRYAESFHYFTALDSLMDQEPDMVWERMFGRINMADLCLKLGHMDEARAYFDETLAFFSRQRLAPALYYLHTQHIERTMREGHINEALALVRQDTIDCTYMVPDQLLLRQRLLISLYRRAGLWQQAVMVDSAYAHLRDSVASNHSRMRFSTALLNYEHTKRLMEKEMELQEHKRQSRLTTASTIVAAVVIVLLFIILVQYRRQRKLRDLAVRGTIASLRMEAIRNRITPHFMGNALSAEMLAQAEGRPVDLDALVQLLHRGIEMTGNEQTTLHDELQFIAFFCKVESRSVGPDFRLVTEIAPDVDDHSVILPSMSVQILVENAIKHGLKRRRPQAGHHRQVTVRATRRDDGTLVEVIDNGTGLTSERSHTERTGLAVVRRTLLLLNEQQVASAGRNAPQMDFALENYRHPDGDAGCRAWIYLPDDFKYTLQT